MWQRYACHRQKRGAGNDDVGLFFVLVHLLMLADWSTPDGCVTGMGVVNLAEASNLYEEASKVRPDTEFNLWGYDADGWNTTLYRESGFKEADSEVWKQAEADKEEEGVDMVVKDTELEERSKYLAIWTLT